MVDRLILTVNSRLARWLLFHHSREQEQAGRKIWETPSVYSIEDWLRQIWLQSWPDQYVLTELQSQYLWQKIIREDSAIPNQNLLHIQGAANHAFKAYQLICQYHMPKDSSAFNNYTEETQAFRRWLTRYQKQLKEWNALDPAELLDSVTKRMKQGLIPLPKEVTFHGFDEISPQFESWINLLKDKKVSVQFEPFEPHPVISDQLTASISQKQATVQKYEDADEEAKQCARWIRSVYKEGETIGIVVPEMEAYRAILEREFKAELAPASVYPWIDKHLPFNLSLGTPLSHEPMVHLALLLLSQKDKRMPLLTFSTLITSSFIKGAPEEVPSRYELDWYLRSGKITQVFLPKALTAKQKSACPLLTTCLDHWMKWLDEKSYSLPSQWAEKISTFLKNLGWPAGALSSRQHQSLESWNECLDRLASLDRVLQKIDRHQAASHLSHIAEGTLFQPQTHEEPIQVIGLLESAGMKFDHLWIMGCHSETLPSYPNPNPFLPFLSLQETFNLPHATAERELQFAEQSLFRLAQACKHLVFSYPSWQGETRMELSPLLTLWESDSNTIQISASSKIQNHPELSVTLEIFEDYSPVPLTPEERNFIKGGTSILKNQAECPFRAFAIHRLTSRKKDFPELDLDDSLKGSLIHKIMELFWEEVQTSERLHELHQSKELLEQIRQCVQKGMLEFRFDIQRQNIFLELERERLTHLIHNWMECERERSHFKVLTTESEKTIDLNGLPLTLKVDRIDQTSDGKTVLIDYKTGLVPNLQKWFGERIEDPQLPLYLMEVDADALAFATIRKGNFRYRGLSREDNILPRVDSQLSKENSELENWQDLRNLFKSGLNFLATEFVQGNLEVAPLHNDETCKYCDQMTFCRKTELLTPTNGETE